MKFHWQFCGNAACPTTWLGKLNTLKYSWQDRSMATTDDQANLANFAVALGLLITQAEAVVPRKIIRINPPTSHRTSFGASMSLSGLGCISQTILFIASSLQRDRFKLSSVWGKLIWWPECNSQNQSSPYLVCLLRITNRTDWDKKSTRSLVGIPMSLLTGLFSQAQSHFH